MLGSTLEGAGTEPGMAIQVDRHVPGPSDVLLGGPWPGQVKVWFAILVLEIEHIFHGRRKKKSVSSEETASFMGNFDKLKIES